MFSYYGAKTKIVDLYPAPKFHRIVEPFAGSARYALKHFESDVTLYELDPKVFAIWQYLIAASERDILGLPNLELGQNIKDIKSLSNVERWLIGYQIKRGSARPGYIVNKRCLWNRDKLRIAGNLRKVRHWKIHNVSGLDHDWIGATYFVDPPYTVQVHRYNFRDVDFGLIKRKVEVGDGQYIVCGNSDDSWAPFVPLATMRGSNKSHVECVWHKMELA